MSSTVDQQFINGRQTTRALVDVAFIEHGPRLTTEQIVRLTGRYTTAVRHYLKEPLYRKIGTTDGTVNGMTIWELVRGD